MLDHNCSSIRVYNLQYLIFVAYLLIVFSVNYKLPYFLDTILLEWCFAAGSLSKILGYLFVLTLCTHVT